MTTAIEFISRAMRLVGVNALGESPSPEESAAGLQALNGMIGSWSNEALLIYYDTVDAIPIPIGNGVITMGPTGSYVSSRPESILNSSYVIYQGVSYACPPLTIDQYNTIVFKTQTAPFPWVLWYESTYPNATITVYPQPNDASTLYLSSKKPLLEFATLTTAAVLPPGYDDAIAYNLAVNFAPEFDATIPQAVLQRAASTKRMLKRTNTKRLVMALPNAVLPTNGYVNWRTGA